MLAGRDGMRRSDVWRNGARRKGKEGYRCMALEDMKYKTLSWLLES
jgi:hypothetical protein